MTSRTWLLFGFLIVLLISIASAQAETISATADTTIVSDLQQSYGGQSTYVGSSKYPTAIAWGQAVVASAENQSKTNPKTGVTSCYPTAGNGYNSCSFSNENPSYPTSSLTFTVYSSCSTGSTWNGSDCVVVTYSCPSEGGWTLEGQSCTRDSCIAQKGQTANSGYYDMGTSASASFPAVGCYGGCSAVFEGVAPATTSIVNGVKHYYAQGAYIKDEFSCTTPSTTEPITSVPPNTCNAATQDGGYVNGKWVCLNKTTQQPEPTDAPKTETKTENTTTNPDGSTTTTTTTNHPDGTSTTETTTTGTDGTKTTTVVTNGGESEKPADGSATEATQKEILDELKKTECEKNPDSFACVTSPLDIVNVDLPESVVNVSITPISVGGAGSCPADHVVDFLGQPVTVSWQLPCQYATGIRPVVLAVAWLSAALILIGAFRQEG